MNKETIDLGLFLLFPQEINSHTTSLREQYKDRATERYSLESIPHISIFQGRFPTTIAGSFESLLQQLRSKAVFRVTFIPQLYVHTSNNLFWNAECDENFKTLQESACALLVPETRGMLLEQFQSLLDSPDSDPRDKELVRLYGFALAEERYMPHITLCNLKEEFTQLEYSHPELALVSEATELSFGEIGASGDIKKILASLPL